MFTAMKKPRLGAAAAGLALLLLAPTSAGAHCQIPCGIYDDNARVVAMLEDAATVRKAVREIAALADKADALSRNQLVRWVLNKERHAQRIIATIGDYFLTQRVKPKQEDYAERLRRHHAVIVAAMRVKQTVDGAAADQLTKAIEALASYYPKHEH